MAEKPIIDPWGSVLPEDYVRIIKDFGLQKFDVSKFPNPNRIMRRHVVFAGRDLTRISNAIKKKENFYVLTGLMPSAPRLHFGSKMVIEDVRYFQEQGAQAYLLVADLEAAATRGISLEEAKQRAIDFHIPAYIALGMDPKKTTFYFQSENRKVTHLAYEFAKKVTLNEFRAVYGQADPSRIMSAVLQAGDILFPQYEEGPMPGVVPVGIDQDPHMRLTRDIVKRTKERFNFVPPASIYNKYTPSLDGGLKMSKSKPESCIELPEDAAIFTKKIKRAVSGGRETLEEHRKLGGIPEKDMAFEMLKQHLIDDDKELQQIYDDYKSGEMTTGQIKEIVIDKMSKFMNDFEAKVEKARNHIDKLNFIE